MSDRPEVLDPMTGRVADFGSTQTTERQRGLAGRFVSRHAHDAADEALLLGMLGLTR